MCDKPDYSLEAYKIAIATRNFEIELYWKRSLFFWGFIATAALGYGSLLTGDEPKSGFALIVACFGLICSLCWSMVNRGSKYWQEHWEEMVNTLEAKIGIDPIFRAKDTLQKKHKWLNARKLSVSRTAIALSDFTIIVWLGLLFNHLLPYFASNVYLNPETKVFLIVLLTCIYSILILITCKSSPWKAHPKRHDLS